MPPELPTRHVSAGAAIEPSSSSTMALSAEQEGRGSRGPEGVMAALNRAIVANGSVEEDDDTRVDADVEVEVEGGVSMEYGYSRD